MLSAAGQDPQSPTRKSKAGHENFDQQANDAELFRSGIFQHLLSVGKDGKVLVQDLRNAYFPGEKDDVPLQPCVFCKITNTVINWSR
jgi:hypothetical protein